MKRMSTETKAAIIAMSREHPFWSVARIRHELALPNSRNAIWCTLHTTRRPAKEQAAIEAIIQAKIERRGECVCCGGVIEYHAYRGEASRRFFGWQKGDTVGPLCAACYRMLFREQVIDADHHPRKLAYATCETCGREMSEKGCAMAYDEKNGRGPYDYYGNTLREARKKKEA